MLTFIFMARLLFKFILLREGIIMLLSIITIVEVLVISEPCLFCSINPRLAVRMLMGSSTADILENTVFTRRFTATELFVTIDLP